MPRLFDGVDDQIQFSIGACSNAGTGFGTVAAILRRDANGTGDAVLELENNAGQRLECAINNSNLPTMYNGTATRRPAHTVTTSDFWCLCVWKKTTGTATPRFGKYRFDNNTWTWGDATDGTLADWSTTAGTSPKVTIGAYNTGGPGSFFSGALLIVGFWGGNVLTDAQCEALPYSLLHWFQHNPTGLWLFDQSDTTMKVPDLTGGGANESSLTGTSVPTTDAPYFFGYGAKARKISRTAGGSTVSGAGAAAIALSASGRGSSTLVGAGSAALGLQASGRAIADMIGRGAVVLGVSASGAAQRMQQGAGSAGISVSASGRLSGIVQGSGSANLGIRASGRGTKNPIDMTPVDPDDLLLTPLGD